MNDQAIRFRLGIFVLAALLILAVLITLFGGLPRFFRYTSSYVIIFPNASGISVGSPVKKSGVKIGEVRTVELDDKTGKVHVGIDVDKEITLRKSDRPSLITSLLGGDSYIAFRPPEDDKDLDMTPVPAGAVLAGLLPPDPGTLLQKTGDLMPPAQEALIEIKKVFQRLDREALAEVASTFRKLDKMMPLLEETTREFRDTAKEFGQLGKATREAVPELRQTNDEIRKLVKNANDTWPELRQTNDEFRKLARNANDTWPTINRTAQEFEAATRIWSKVGERADILLQTNEERISRTLDSVQRTFDRAANLLNDDNQRMVQGILKDVRAGTQRLDGLTRNADEMMQETRIAVRQANKTLGKLDETLTQVNKVTGPLADRSPAILKNVEEGTIQLNLILRDVRELIQAVGRNEGTVQKLLSDPALYNNLNDSALMVTRIIPRLDRILRDVEIFADKVARHPESLGIGGVVRPSSGLKESPTFWPYSPRHP